ncbi:unnamed protein product [Coregonus sp. 'balchen']|nr:unnamed protein product [Coregonus sp. 'balchen']
MDFSSLLFFQSSSNGVRLGTPNRATITILSNDNAFGIISFNSDLSPDRGNITIPPGQALVVFSILIQDDQIPEDDEVFTVRLTGVAGGAVLNPNGSSVELKIRRNDSPLRFSQSQVAVAETAGVISLIVTRGLLADHGRLVGSDDTEISVDYVVVSGDGAGSATPAVDFVDLQAVRTVTFPPWVYEARLLFNISDDEVPEIAESFHVVLLEETVRGDAVLIQPNTVLVTIEPNDKPHGVLSISGSQLTQLISINEDKTDRFDGISIVRNGGNYGDISVNWTISRNSSDRSPVSDDLSPEAGTLWLTAGQMSAVLPLNITADELPEEAEAFILRLLPDTVQGGAEVDEPMEMMFYIQDSDDVYGLFRFHPEENQTIQSQPDGRFLSLSFLREGGTLGEVALAVHTLYIPAGPVNPGLARDGVLNGSRSTTVLFSQGQDLARLTLPIRNDAFLQNGAHFLIQLDSVDLISISPPIPSVSPHFGGALNLTLTVTPEIANGEIGFTSNTTVVVYEPEDTNTSTVTLSLRRDGTDGQAVVFWSLRPIGDNQADVTTDDLKTLSGSVVFLTGQSDAVINVTVMADDIPEVNETLFLTLDRVETPRFVVYFGVNVENQILKPGFTSREIVIVENDDPGGVFEFSPFSRGPWYINEGEAVELRVIRAQGQLLKQLVRYVLMPSGNAEFYGATGILEFKPGEREVLVALVARPDGVPELDETFSMVLSSYSNPPSRLGNHREVNITVRKNDDPFGVIEFARSGVVEAINESKGSESHSVAYPVVRNRGRFGEVSVSWVLEPHLSADVSPVQGSVVFAEGEYVKNLTLFSVPDELPEDMENFTITLLNATGGARLGNILNASLQINKNDDPIYFAEPVVVRLQEGDVANFTVLRAGPADFVATVMYRVDYGEASLGDLAPLSNDTVLVFDVGECSCSSSVFDSCFCTLTGMKAGGPVGELNYRTQTHSACCSTKPASQVHYSTPLPGLAVCAWTTLSENKGDAVVYGADTGTVVIEANDEANGIFSLESTERSVEEGKTNNFNVIRARGHFGNVTVFWRLYANDTALEPGQEFINNFGSITFTTGEETKPIVLEAISDKLPEFNEFYILRLTNISGGCPGEGGRLTNTSLNASVLIPFNDDPFGVFTIAVDNLDQEVAEDILSEEDMSDVTSFTILRQQGTFGEVRVAWEIVSVHFPLGLPPMQDLLLSASFPKEVELRPHSRRHHSGTDAWFFSGLQGAYGTISPEEGPGSLANFTFSAWLVSRPDTNGFIVSKGNRNGTLYYGVKIQTNESHVSVMLYYTALGANNTQVARATAERFVEDNVWLHVLITVDDGIIEFFLNGNLMPRGIKMYSASCVCVAGSAPVRIGSDPYGEQRYTGLLQDLRLYHSRLNRLEIHELHAQPTKMDLRNISGYLQYWQDERQKAFVVEVRDDKEEEGEEVFYLQLVATSEEGSTISCVIERMRGALDHVYVNYSVTQLDSDSQVLNLLVLDDDTPEFAESFQVTLVSAESGDGKPGSTPTSGASIDPDNSATTVTITASDHPYGLIQFQTSLPAEGMIRPATEPAHVTVNEEDGEVHLLVARAQGLLGRVMVGYRTSPFTAVSPEDYEDSDGLLDFLPGERFKYINVTVIDNPVPELDKVFRVELYNPDGGVDQFLRSEGSGSGESDTEFFLPSSHRRASLGVASHITVTIAASDDAHGVFQLSQDSLSVNGTEPEEGRSTVLLQVVRSFGALSNVTVFWEAEDSSEEDLISRAGNITFHVGQTRGEIELQVAQDEVPELDKSFAVSLVNVSHGRLGVRTEASVTVLASDDPYGVFVFSENSMPVRLPEGHTLVILTIHRQRGLMGKVRVTYGTLSEADGAPFMTPGVGRASEGNDFVPLLESVVFTANQSEANVTLRVLDDEDPERDESVFVELISVNLIEGEQERLIAQSPRLGPKAEIVAQVIVEASDDAFGFLQLSAPAVSVAEDYVGPIINVTRIGGIFADVSLEETFRIELLNVTTGGARLGELTRTIITILPSDDPFGAFVFQAAPVTIEEPGANSFEVTLPIVRNAGTIGTVAIQWRATVNGKAAVGDLRPVSGEVIFAPGETIKTLNVEVLADDVPEIEEIIKVELTGATNGGNLGIDNTVNIIVPANDNPYGTVYFDQSVYRVQEPLEGIFLANITVRRSGGHFSRVEVLYSTSEIDIVSMAQTEGQNLLLYYNPPVSGVPSGTPHRPVNVSSQGDPLAACAAVCLREQACQAFSLSLPGGSSPMAFCTWVTSGAAQLTASAQTLTYAKNTTAAAVLFSSQAVAGSDYTTMTAQTAILEDGSGVANLTVPILTDKLPEMDESFSIRILKVELVNLTVAGKNLPSIGQPDKAVVTIGMNGDAFGVFLIYSLSPNATEDGIYLEVREEPRVSVPLVIERRGGSLGQLTVEWRFVGGMATPNTDFTGTGETLVFADGDLKKTIEIVIVDDSEPEDSETLMVGLVKTAGGSRILPSSDTVTIVILANDNVAGVVGFHAVSRSVIAREGEMLSLLVTRTAPGLGNATVDWAIQGPRVARTFTHTSGLLFFTEGTLNTTIVLQLLEDATPEENEEYRVVLSNIHTYGVLVTGHAALDIQGREAVVTVETSDEPFGMLSIAPSSLRLSTEERDGILNNLSQVEGGGGLAEPGQDFLPASGSDDVPELQEFFLVNITSAVLITTLSPAPKLDTQGLVAEISIGANDGIRGVIEWTNTNFEVNETMGVLSLVAYRSAGTYGNMLHFADGERHKFVEVQILDDVIPEGAERFQLILANPSSGLELGDNTTAMVSILASDDGHGVISFNSSQHFLLREPTSVSGLGESVATLYVVRDPPQGTFGTVNVQFTITDANETLAQDDLMPWQGIVELEDGVRFKTLEIWAVLDAEPEVNETFTAAVSVEWETQSDTAIAMEGNLPVMAVYQIFPETPTSSWCSLAEGASPLAMRLDRPSPGGSTQTRATLYRWQGVLVPIQSVRIQDPSVCVGFSVNGSSYVAITHGGHSDSPAVNLSLFRVQPDLNLTLEQTLAVEALDVKHFSVEKRDYLIASSLLVANSSCFYQVFVRTGSTFSVHQSLELQGVLSVSLFSHGTSLYLAACVGRETEDACVLFQWSEGHFQNPRPLPVSSRAQQVESLTMGADILLLVVTEGSPPSCEVFVWGPQQQFPQHSQSIPHPGLGSVHPFTLPSGITHVLLAGRNGSALYSWRSDISLFAMVLRSPPASHFLSLPLPYFNTTKSLIAATEPSGSTLYELTTVSNHSDYIPSYGELRFAPGDREMEIAVNIIDDDAPEEEEQFRVGLKNPKGGAEIGFGGQMTVLIPTNDDAYGVIGFAQASLTVEVEELAQSNPISLSVERRRGTFGRLTVHWAANGSLEDIFPTSGVVTFSEGQVVATIFMTVVVDSVPELRERVTLTLMDVTTVGLDQPSRGALIDPQRAQALLTILPNGSPYGVIGWHLDSQYLHTQEPQKSPTNVTLTIVREQGASGEVAVHYQTRPALSRPPSNQASAPQDYTPREDTVIMKEHATVALVTITILPPSVKRPGMEVAEVTIQENDDPRGVLQFSVSQEESGGVLAYEVPPPGNLLRLPVVRLAGRTGRVVVYWEAQTITASLNDFIPASGNITFQDGQGEAFIDISIMDDTEVESAERFGVTLMRVIGGARLGERTSVTITIPPNDSPLGHFGFQEQTVTISEPAFTSDPAAMATLTVLRSAGGEGAVTLVWRLEDAARDDLSPLNGTLVFSETELRKTLGIRALADALLEGDESFNIQLLAAKSGAVIDPINGLATITIQGDRAALGMVGIAEASRNVLIGEPQGNYNGTALISLVRGPGIFGEIQVYWNITPAVASEFEELSGVVTMRDRQSAATIRLKALDDDTAEERRVYQLTLTSVTPGAEISPSAQWATVTMAASDLPYGLFSFPQGLVRASEEEGKVNVTVVRSMGTFGSVWVTYQTAGSVAVSGVDFTEASGSLLFSPGQTTRDHGLQRDQPPAIGNISSIMIVIQKNDNAEGILEFLPDYVNITDYISRGLTASPGLDYSLANGSLTFLHGHNTKYAEMFEIQLSSATGGAILGTHLVASITIAKSDSPNSVVRFLNESVITLVNPNSTLRLSLLLERVGGLVGDTTITWSMLGPNTKEVLPPVNTDIGEPVNGSFHFRDGEGGLRIIDLSILPHGEVEEAETFVVMLELLSGDVDIDPRAGSVTLKIEKFGDPNGIVQFTEEDLRERVYSEPTDSEGPLNISLLIMRREGVMGNITVHWQILSDSDTSGDFSALSGSMVILEGQRGAEVVLALLPDAVPELEELYTLRLSAVEGGATLDANRSSTQLRVRANDEPHGLFGLEAEQQAVVVAGMGAGLRRLLTLNVTRQAGAFGNASVGYRISTGPGLDGQELLGEAAVGRALVKDGEDSASVSVTINSEVFLSVGVNFTVELTDVSLLGPLLSSPPRLLLEAKVAMVGFVSLALQVSSVETGVCEALVSRTGLFGGVRVEWSAGYPPGQAPVGFKPGVITPSSGSVTLAHGERSKAMSLQALHDVSEPASYALHLTAAGSSSPAPGVARLRSGFTVAEVEPLGVYQFAPDSRQLVIEEDVQTITLYVQRLYGFRSNRTRLSYETASGSALAGQDFTAVQDGELFFDLPHQTSASLRLSVLDDVLSEPDEIFYVNLTDVQVLSRGGDSRPRLTPQHSVATVTILASDVTGGVLSIGPGLVQTAEDREEGSQQDRKVLLKVHRSDSLAGPVRVRVQAYGGGSVRGAPLPFALEPNRTLALEGQDFRLESALVSLQEGQSEAEVSLLILDDSEPEGQEVFFIYLSDPEGGAQITDGPDKQGFSSFAKIIILGSDFHNGIVGFSVSSLLGQVLDEDSEMNRTALLYLQRQQNRAFEDVEVMWRATFNRAELSLVNNGVNLTRELLQTSGTVLCRRGQVLCVLSMEVRQDQEPEYQAWFLVEIYQVGVGAAINESARFANVTLLESDDPRGLVYFAVGSRLPVALLKTTRLSLQVYREASTASTITVRYRMLELPRAEAVGPTLVWPAVAGMDFLKEEGQLTFDQGQRSTGLDITLTPDQASSNPPPKRFRVELYAASGGARVHPEYGLANVTLVSDTEAQLVWALLDQLQQPLDSTTLDRVLQALLNKATAQLTPEQLTAVLVALGKVLKEAERTPLADSSRGLTYDLLCAMANPSRVDTQGLSQLAEVAERFAFSLLTNTQCGAQGQRGRTILDTCAYISISAYHWYPTQINGHMFMGKNSDTFQLPETLLEVPALPAGTLSPSACRRVQLTEYSTEHCDEVVYRIHTPGSRVKPGQSLCLLWNQAAESWLSDGQFCRIVEDSGNYVECACSHLSVYTAHAEIAALASYNEAFYTSGFICISGFALAIVSHLLCSRFPMFAAKLLTHMMMGCLGTQVRGPPPILSPL